jgi:sialic acid synthase SpsE/mannose-6-phosphate isomerase-like protein (cupin superfamily)
MTDPAGFDFADLFVFELANNHQGDLEHGKRIVRELGALALRQGIRAAVKLQFRDLDTFIHPAHREKSDNKHIPRFLATRLRPEEFAALVEETRRAGLVTMCTPFDEPSVDRIVEMGIEVVKVGSCSLDDWPLLEKIATANKPVVFSTGGATSKLIDDVVSFFDHRRVRHAIMHCVSIYPTPDENANLNLIEALRRRYPETVIGYSTHEAPENLAAVRMAVAKGARMLERHVGIAEGPHALNAYSSTPAQAEEWVKAARHARLLAGPAERPPSPAVEQESLRSLKRGIFARRALKKGERVAGGDVYFAMPVPEGGLHAGEWDEALVTSSDVAKDEALGRANLVLPEPAEKEVLFTAIHTIKGMLNEARIALSTDFEAEFSHHYGVPRFPEWGATIIDCINREYCKKLIIQIPGQRHPLHYHKRKEESFQMLWGVLHLELEGRPRTLYPGDIALIQQGVWHAFRTETGAIFEEISTTHFNDDSFYEDKAINQIPRAQRKTRVNNWGRYQI